MVRLVQGATVYLDGIELKQVVTFNISEGWVECYVTSPSGYNNRDAGAADFLRSRLYGHVEISEGK